MNIWIRQKYYNNILLESHFTLCPSGTGPNSIRFWEALGAGSIPILLSDNLDLPSHKLWDKSIIRISENDCMQLPSLINDIFNEIEERRKNCIIIYNFFKNNYIN